jgi:hypothetical protein
MGLLEWMEMDTERQKAPKKLATQIRRNALEELRQKREAKIARATNKPTPIPDAAPLQGQLKTSVEEQKVEQGMNLGGGNAKIKLPNFKKRRIEQRSDDKKAPSPKRLRVDNIETSRQSYDVRAKGVLSANHQRTPADRKTSKAAQSNELNSTNKGDEASKKRRLEQSAHGKKPDPVKRVRLDGREASTRRDEQDLKGALRAKDQHMNGVGSKTAKPAPSTEQNDLKNGVHETKKRSFEHSTHGQKAEAGKRVRLDGIQTATQSNEPHSKDALSAKNEVISGVEMKVPALAELEKQKTTKKTGLVENAEANAVAPVKRERVAGSEAAPQSKAVTMHGPLDAKDQSIKSVEIKIPGLAQSKKPNSDKGVVEGSKNSGVKQIRDDRKVLPGQRGPLERRDATTHSNEKLMRGPLSAKEHVINGARTDTRQLAELEEQKGNKTDIQGWAKKRRIEHIADDEIAMPANGSSSEARETAT